MPYEAIKLPRSSMYKVLNVASGAVSAKKTTKAKADRQIRLLRGIEAKRQK